MVIYLTGVIVVLLFLVIPGNALINEFQDLFNDIAATYEVRFPGWLEGSSLERTIAAELPPPDQLYETLTGPAFVQEFLGATRGFFGIIGSAAVVLILSIYWTIDQARLERYWFSILPSNHRVQARKIWRATEEGIGAYIRSEIIQSMAAALLLLAVYALLGLDFPFILAGLAAASWLIPLVGAIFAVIPVLAVGLLHNSLGLSMVAALCTIAILSGLELLVEPRLFNRRRYNATTTVLLMLIFLQDFGLIGLIMGPPITAALQIFFNHLVSYLTVSASKAPGGEVELLQERLNGLLIRKTGNGDEVSAELSSLGERLSKLLDEAKQIT